MFLRNLYTANGKRSDTLLDSVDFFANFEVVGKAVALGERSAKIRVNGVKSEQKKNKRDTPK